MPTTATTYPISPSAVAPWWLWPNILSLDAPAIAWLWQSLAAKDTGVNLSIASRTALPLAVWAIYLADRLIDSIRFDQASETARHAFYRNHRVASLALLVLVSTVLAWTLRFLPAPVLRSGLLVSAWVAVYMLAVHALPSGVRRYLPKELAVALIFSAGTTLSIWTRMPNPVALLFPALLFALLCWLNCSAIEAWEKALPGLPVTRLQPISLALCFTAMAASPFVSFRLLLLAVALSSLAYCWLDRVQKSLNANALRVLADLPLAAPLLLLFFR